MSVAALAGTLVLLAAWRRLLWSGLVPLDVNVVAYAFPNWALFKALAAGGRVPLWNPARNLGEPFWADPATMAAYPPFWIASLLPDFDGFMRLWTALHTLIAASFAAALGWRLTKDRAASATAAVLAGLNGFFMARAGYPNQFAAASWLWPFLYFEDALSWRGMAVSLAMAWLSGFPPFVIVIAASGVVVAAARGRAALVRLVLAFAGGAGLAAFQWAPFLELLRLSVRPVLLDPSVATYFSIPPRQLLKETLLPLWSALSPGLSGDPGITTFYVGLPALGLAVWGLRRSGPREKAIAAIGAAALLLSLGAWLPGYREAAFLRIFRFPANWLLAALPAVAALSARGVAELPAGRRWAAAAAVAVDLALFAQFPLGAWARPRYFTDVPALASRLAGEPLRRFYITPRMLRMWEGAVFSREEDFDMMREFLAPSFGTAFGVQEARSFQVLETRIAAGYLGRAAGPAAARMLDWAGVAAVVDAVPGARVLSGATVRVLWRNSHVSRIFLARGRGLAAIESYRPGEVSARILAEGPVQAVFSEIVYPGWRAQLDGREAAQGLFEGAFPEVDIPAGKHELRFKFVSRTFRLGLAISILSFLVIFRRPRRA